MLANKQKKHDRRKDKRYIAKNGAFAALSKNNRLGQIMNVSRSGLAFRYIEDKNDKIELDELKILMPQVDFFLEQVIFKTVSDFAVEQNLPFRSIQMRQAGLQFRNLTPKQELKLSHFILNHTMGEA